MTCTTVPPVRLPVARRLGVSGLWSVASVRWATAALVLFAAGLAAQLLGAPSWSWWACYLACYLTGG